MDYISSGNIAPNYIYRVVSDTITYNSVTYNSGDEFTGISGVTTFTGNGQVIEEILVSNVSTELIDRVWDGPYTEQLELYDIDSEIVQNQNGTVFSDQLELYNISTELGEKRKSNIMLVYSN